MTPNEWRRLWRQKEAWLHGEAERQHDRWSTLRQRTADLNQREADLRRRETAVNLSLASVHQQQEDVQLALEDVEHQRAARALPTSPIPPEVPSDLTAFRHFRKLLLYGLEQTTDIREALEAVELALASGELSVPREDPSCV
jgi:hypothetical protein